MAFVPVCLKSSFSWISFMGSFQLGGEDNTQNFYDEDKPLGHVLYQRQKSDTDLQMQTSWVLCHHFSSFVQSVRKP